MSGNEADRSGMESDGGPVRHGRHTLVQDLMAVQQGTGKAPKHRRNPSRTASPIPGVHPASADEKPAAGATAASGGSARAVRRSKAKGWRKASLKGAKARAGSRGETPPTPTGERGDSGGTN